jgi:antitoxin HicB
MRFAYPIEIRAMTADEGGGFLVEFPDWWGGAVTDGADMAEARANARDCLEEMIAYCIRRREPIPKPSRAGNRLVVEPEAGLALKAALWLTLRDQGITVGELARRMGGLTEAEAERLLNPRLKARPELIHKGLTVLGKRVVVELEDAA